MNTSPPLKRRLAVMLYEGLVLFGVVFATGLVFDALSDSRHALVLRSARQACQFLVLGLYFIYFWHRGGQTLPMKTWHVRLVAPGHARVPLVRAAARYLMAWLWFLPGLATAWAFGLKAWASVAVVALGMVLWAATMFLDRERQFLHDRLAGTRLILDPPIDPSAAK